MDCRLHFRLQDRFPFFLQFSRTAFKFVFQCIGYTRLLRNLLEQIMLTIAILSTCAVDYHRQNQDLQLITTFHNKLLTIPFAKVQLFAWHGDHWGHRQEVIATLPMRPLQ